MPRLSDIDFTIKYRPGRDLTGVDAEIAEMTDSEPYALATVELGTSGFERVFDPRDYPEKEQEVLDLAIAIIIAAKAHDQLFEALEMVRDADEDCKRDGLKTMPPMAREDRRSLEISEIRDMTDQKSFRALRDALLDRETSLAKKLIVRRLDELYADGFQGTAILAALKEIINGGNQMFGDDDE